MEAIKHSTLSVNGINMHVAEAGPADGGPAAPTILFLHGFPQLWYAWRHQLLHLSALGYRCVAPDLRGYGDTDAPQDQTSFTVFHVVGDLVALLDSLGLQQVVLLVLKDWIFSFPFLFSVCVWWVVVYIWSVDLLDVQVFLVGHDWGAIIAWNLCLFRPDRVKALVNLSVPYRPRNQKLKPLQTLHTIYGDDYYMCRFQVFWVSFFSPNFIFIFPYVLIWKN